MTVLFTACAGMPQPQMSARIVASAGDTTPQTDEEPSPGAPSLRILSDPEGATVYLDGRRAGTTPITIEGVQPGNHLLRVEKSGYYESRQWIQVSATTTLVVRIDLQLITGYLDIEIEPLDATLTVGDERVRDRFIELPVGTHRVHAQRFGYEPQTERVRITPRSLTRLSIELERAPFRMSELEVWRPAFSPESPGAIGTTRISYRVTAPGTAEIIIRDDDDTVVHQAEQGPFTDWEHSYRWDGTDDEGRLVPDGTYQIELVGVGDDGRVETLSAEVRVDRSLLVRYRSGWTAMPGLLYSPTRAALPGGQTQLSALLAVATRTGSVPPAVTVPGRVAARVGLGAGFELFGFGGITATGRPHGEAAGPSYDDRLTVGGALTWDGLDARLGRTRLGAGLSVGGMHESRRPFSAPGRLDLHGSDPGLFVSLPVSIRGPAVEFGLAPEYRVVAPHDGRPEWTGLAALRSGVTADFGQMAAGISGVVSYPLEEWTVVPSVSHLGLEAHWIPPRSAVALSAFAASRLSRTDAPLFLAGIGVGILF